MSEPGIFIAGVLVTAIVLSVTWILYFGFKEDIRDREDKRRAGRTAEMDLEP